MLPTSKQRILRGALLRVSILMYLLRCWQPYSFSTVQKLHVPWALSSVHKKAVCKGSNKYRGGQKKLLGFLVTKPGKNESLDMSRC